MTAVRAILAYLQGREANGSRPAVRLCGSPYRLHLQYLGGHPGIWEPEPFWVGRVGDRIRMVDQQGQRCYDMEVARIQGVTCSIDGHLFVRYEPTPGLITTVEFRSPDGAKDSYSRLLHLWAATA